MSFEVLNILFTRIDEYLTQFPDEEIKILWHGGEPLLLGAHFFAEVNRIIRTKHPGIRSKIKHDIQSNLTLLDEPILKQLRELGIKGFGTSYDPVENIRGGGTLKNSAGYNQKLLGGVKLLEDHHISWGFIYVVTRESLNKPEEIFNFCTNFNLKNNFNIHPVVIAGDEEDTLSITAEEYGHFLGATFNYWWPTRQRYPSVEPFFSYVKTYTQNGRPEGCETSGACSHSHIYIGPEGQTSHCGKIADQDILSYGNIRDHTLDSLLKDIQRNILAERVQKLAKEDCSSCRFWEICHGGCPADAFAKKGVLDERTFFCESTKIFLEQYFEPTTGWKKDFYKENQIAGVAYKT